MTVLLFMQKKQSHSKYFQLPYCPLEYDETASHILKKSSNAVVLRGPPDVCFPLSLCVASWVGANMRITQCWLRNQWSNAYTTIIKRRYVWDCSASGKEDEGYQELTGADKFRLKIFIEVRIPHAYVSAWSSRGS